MNIWYVVILATVLIEIALAGSLFSIWFTIGGFAALLATMAGFDFKMQLIIFLAVSILSILFIKPLADKCFISKKTPTNADKLIGSKQRLIEPIKEDKWGKIRVNDQEWSATTEDKSAIPVDTLVEVVAIEGVKLIVKKI